MAIDTETIREKRRELSDEIERSMNRIEHARDADDHDRSDVAYWRGRRDGREDGLDLLNELLADARREA